MSSLAARRARRARRDAPEVQGWAQKAFADHRMTPAEVRSFTFRKPNAGSSYWFGLTWRSGHLTLVGDLGEMTLTHYSALADFEGGIRWAARADYQYLMEKSDKREKELDKDGTVADIVRMANENAIWIMEQVVNDRRRNRRDRRNGVYEFEAALAKWDFWRAFGESDEDNRPRLEDYLPDHHREEDAETLTFKRKPDREDWRYRYASHPEWGHTEQSKWIIPDGWELWWGVWEAVRHHLDTDDGDPNILRTKDGRRRVTAALDRHINADMGADAVAEFCRGELDIDDYYGNFRYKAQTIWQIEAIHHGSNMILDELDPKRTWGKAWGDPVV